MYASNTVTRVKLPFKVSVGFVFGYCDVMGVDSGIYIIYLRAEGSWLRDKITATRCAVNEFDLRVFQNVL